MAICIFVYLLICIFWAQAKTQLITTHISLGKNVEDYILITETVGIKATVTIDFYNQKGDLVESIRKILPSHATIKIQVSNFLHETGIIIVNSDSDGIAGQHYYAAHPPLSPRQRGDEGGQKRKDRVLISAPLQIRKAESVSREIETEQVGARQFCIPYVDFISDLPPLSSPRIRGERGGAEQLGAGVGSYIVVSDASGARYTSGSIFEMRFYNREGEAISKVKSEIGKRETAIFKLLPPPPPSSEGKGGQGGFTGVNHVAKFGKVNLNITEGDVICEYVQFHPSNGVLIIPGIIYDSENKLPTPAPPKEGTEVPIVLYRFPLFSLQTPKGLKHKSDSPFIKGGLGEEGGEKLFITDVFGYGPAVNIEVLNNSLDILAQTKKLLPSHGTSMLELEDYTRQEPRAPTNVVFGAIKIHSQSQIAAVYYFSPSAPQVSTSILYSYAASSAGASEGERKGHESLREMKGKATKVYGSKKLPTSDFRFPTSFVIPWFSPCDNMEIHLLITNTENEVNEILINFYHKDGSSFKEGQEGKGERGQGGKSAPKVYRRDMFSLLRSSQLTDDVVLRSALLKPGIIHEWQPGILFPKDEQGSILLDSSSSNLAVLLLGVNANTGQIVMSVQAQIQLKGE